MVVVVVVLVELVEQVEQVVVVVVIIIIIVVVKTPIAKAICGINGETFHHGGAVPVLTRPSFSQVVFFD